VPLLNLTKRVADSFGLAHKIELDVLRHYIKTTDEVELAGEIWEIDNARYLRVLWEAGLSARLQVEVLEQLEKIS